MPKIIESVCPECKGTGIAVRRKMERIGSVEMRCRRCNGTGKVQTFEVDIPPPIRKYKPGAKQYQG